MKEGRLSYFEEKNLFRIFHEKGIIHAVVNININYKKSAKVGDVLIIVTDILKAGKNSFTMFQRIFLKDTDILVVDAEVTNVFIDMNTGKVVPVDNEIISLWPDLGNYFNKDKSSFSKST
ncbi:MAG: thioesterase family protein [Deltaproteobacteria bacterium]|nr:thioesterase family protein [Deltaproteobacteria bacterium]